MAVITLDVGVKFNGHASEDTPQFITISDDFAKDDSLLPTTDMMLIFSNFMIGNIEVFLWFHPNWNN